MTIAELKESIEKMKTNEPDYIGKAYNNGLDFCLEMIDVYDKFREDEQALSQEPTEKPMTVDEMEREYEKSKALFHKIVECDDAISREAVINMLDGMIKDSQVYFGHNGKIEYSCGFSTFKLYVEQLPPVTQKLGKWQYVPEDKGWYICSECNCGNDYADNFCPQCGAKMEREDKG